MIPKPQKQQQRRYFLSKNLIIVLIGLIIFAIGTCFWILSSGRVISDIWSYVLSPVFAFFGLALSLLAWLFPNAFHPKSKSPSAQSFQNNPTKSKNLSRLTGTPIAVQEVHQYTEAHTIQSYQAEIGQPSVDRPALLCFAIDVSATMIDSVVDHAGKTMKRWANIQTVLDRFIYLGTAIVKDVDTRKVLPLYHIMAYGFGFTEVAYQLHFTKKPGGAVRDLLDHPTLSKFPSAEQITDHWNEYKDHFTSRKYTPDLLGDTPMCQALVIIRDRIHEELTHKDFTLPILLLMISDGNPTDGDPLPIIEELHGMGVLTLCCFLGNQDILNAKRLYESERQQWTEGAKLMFRMASILRKDSYITRAMFDYLEETGWHPQEGIRLFAQINHTEALDSFLKILLSGFMQERQV